MPGPLHPTEPVPAARSRRRTSLWLAVGLGALLLAGAAAGLFLWKRAPAETPAEAACKRGTQALLASLGEPVRVSFYVSKGGLPKVDLFSDSVDRLLRDYQARSGGKLAYSMTVVTTDADRAAARDAGLQEATFGDTNDAGAAQIMRGFVGLSFHYRDEKEVIPLLAPEQTQGLSFWIANKIRELRDRADDRSHIFGLLTGKDEIKLSEPNLIGSQAGAPGPSMQSLLEQNFPFYTFKNVDLQGGDAEIPREYAGLIVTQAGKRHDEKELRRIDEFLMLGGKVVLVFAGAVNVKPSDPNVKATLDTQGLERLLDGYGIEMKREAIFDWGQAMVVPMVTQAGTKQPVFPGIVIAKHDDALGPDAQTLDSTFTGFFRIDELAFPFPSTLVVHPEKQPGARVTVVARTSPRANVDERESSALALGVDRQPTGDAAPRAMAVAVDGTMTSAFGGKQAPGRLLVVSASQFLANPFARAGNPPPVPPQMAMLGQTGGDEMLQALAGPYAQKYLTYTILSFKNTLDWATAEEDLVSCGATLVEKHP
jgi:hypothetical protein